MTQSDGAAAAVGLHLDLSVTGEPAGVGGGDIQGVIDGTIDIGLTECVTDGLAHTGADTTIVISLAAVMFLAAGGSVLLWTRRRLT